MNSSSSDSDSDDNEPIRRIKINIRPKEDVSKKGAADVDAIKASVEAWRPLGPPTHPSLSRRQSSLTSVSSMSFGTGSTGGWSGAGLAGPAGNVAASMKESSHGEHSVLRSSPSCSSLVNEFSNRSSFSNFMSTTSRTSSPLTIMNHSDTMPIAIAIQESIELIVKGHHGPNDGEARFDSRAMGNIKVAFPSAFARCNNSIGSNKSVATLKIRMHSTDNIIRYYASRLIKDLDLENNSVAESKHTYPLDNINNNSSINGNSKKEQQNNSPDLLDLNNSPTPTLVHSNTQIIEFDMDVLVNHLRTLQEQSPTSRYYNLDVLRYQITPIKSIEECPLQVCSYWKVDPKLVKLRIDFKHSSKSGLQLERLREITFSVDLTKFIPTIPPIITYEPQAQWSLDSKQLTWKLDNLLPYYKTGGHGSLFAKLDFRHYQHPIPENFLDNSKPVPVDIKFMVFDSTLSKISMSIDSIGYRMSLLKKEIRSGRYKIEPYIL